MNRFWFFTFVLLIVFSCKISAQKTFDATPEKNGHLTLEVLKNDTVIIKDKRAYVLSINTYNAYKRFENKYLKCLNNRQRDIQEIDFLLHSLLQRIEEIDKLISDNENITDDLLKQSESKLNKILEELNQDISKLNNIKGSVSKAQKKLDELENRIQKTRKKIFWQNTKNIMAGCAIGLLIGIIFL